MDNKTASDMQPDVRAAATVTARHWPTVIDAGDAEQEIWLHLVERPGSTDKLHNMGQESRRNALVAVGHQIASAYRMSYEVFSGQVQYGTEEVKAMLGEGILTMDYEDIGAGTETLTSYMDITEGVQILRDRNERYADILTAQYVLGDPIHEHWRVLSRAVDALTVAMNRAHKRRESSYEDGPGTRKATPRTASAD